MKTSPENQFNPNIGDHIFILDRSWIHHPGDVYNDKNWRYNESIGDGLYKAEAEVIGKPYMKTIHGTEEDYGNCHHQKTYEVRMVNVRVLKNNEEYAIVAEHKNDHAVSLEDLEDKLFYRGCIEREFSGSEI